MVYITPFIYIKILEGPGGPSNPLGPNLGPSMGVIKGSIRVIDCIVIIWIKHQQWISFGESWVRVELGNESSVIIYFFLFPIFHYGVSELPNNFILFLIRQRRRYINKNQFEYKKYSTITLENTYNNLKSY